MTELIVVGPGELGRFFAGGALKRGTVVHPVPRGASIQDVTASEHAPVLVAVPEKALPEVARGLPPARRAHAIVVQNELFPPGLQQLGLAEATVAVVWLAKKAGQPVRVARASEAHGPHAADFVQWCAALDVPARELPDATALAAALIEKYAFILAINTLGLRDPITIGAWLDRDEAQVDAVIDDAARLGAALCGPGAPAGHDAKGPVKEAMRALSDYPAKGRTAADRLHKAWAEAEARGLDVPALRSVKNSLG